MLPERPREEESPSTFGRFLLVERLAAGGMAEVYASRPLRTSRLPRVVAIKRMLPDIAARGDFIDMFVDEAKLVSRLEHDNIVRSYEYGREAGSYYIAMEMLSGLDMSHLATLVARRRRRIPPEIASWIAEQVCAGLAHAHALEDDDGSPVGLIHRDITPHNLIVGFDGTVKIIDFGIAKSAIQRSETTVGMLKGKVCYMSPEQATRTARIDYRSDIYSTGVCLWEWLAGRRMHSPELHFLKTLKKVRVASFEPIEAIRPGLPEELTQIVGKALSKDPAHRYQSAEEMRQALEAYRSVRCSKPRRALRRWLDRELADQRMKHEQRLSAISATPMPEGTIAYHPELELVAAEQRREDRLHSSFVEAPTEVFFSIDVELDDADEADGLDDAPTEAAPTDIEVELPSWDSDASGVKTRVTRRPRGRRTASAKPVAETKTLIDKSPWWSAYAEMAQPDDWSGDDAATQKHLPKTHDRKKDDTPRLIDTLRPVEQPAPAAPPPETRGMRPAWVLSAAAAAAALVGVTFFFTQQGSLGAHGGEGEVGILQVRLSTDVELATVFIDGVERGAAPLTLGTLGPGSHEVRVVADGFVELVQDVEVASGATTIVAASLSERGAAPGSEPSETAQAANERPEPSDAAEPRTATDMELASDLGREPAELTEEESARLAADEARREREERWERLLAVRARRARIAARRAATSAADVGPEMHETDATSTRRATPEAATESPSPPPSPRALGAREEVTTAEPSVEG